MGAPGRRARPRTTLIAVGLSAALGAGPTFALDQTSDGTLWIGSSLGLYRFDGVEFERYAPPAGQQLPSYNIYALLATPDGGLWASFRPAGLGFLKAARFIAYTEPAELPAPGVYIFANDDDGRVWGGVAMVFRKRVLGPSSHFALWLLGCLAGLTALPASSQAAAALGSLRGTRPTASGTTSWAWSSRPPSSWAPSSTCPPAWARSAPASRTASST